MKANDKWATDWADMPETMTFDELISSPLYANFSETFAGWKVLLSNGTFYRMDRDDHELGHKCGALECADRVFIT